jgi:hypothetical protein
MKKELGMGDRSDAGVYTVVQFNPIRKVKGMKCEKRISTITAVCGAFSHSKLVAPPDILSPVMVTEQECKEVIRTQLLTTEDQRQIRINLNGDTIYKYVEAGAVTMSEHNVACEGGEMKVYGKKHDNILRLVTVKFRVTEVDVFEKNQRLRTSEDGNLPRACMIGLEGCALLEMTLVIDLEKINFCPYVQIRASRFEIIANVEKGIESNLWINDEHKLLFEPGEKIPLPTDCRVPGTLIKTNFERIFLMTGDLGNGIDLINAASIDLELETRVTDYYLAYWSELVVRESDIRMQNQICQLAASKLENDQILLHDNHILKRQGELILEFVCNPIKARTRGGYKREGDVCFDHLPVYLEGDKPAFLTPISRIVTQRNAVGVVNCSAHYPYMFEDIDGRMITANPDVKEVPISMSDHHFLDAKTRNHSEVFKFSSLLYTKDEVQAYESMLQGHSAEKAVTRKFSSYYCEATGECTPSRGTKDFQWKRLLNPSEILDEWWESIKWKLIWWAVLWACMDSIVTTLQMTAKLWIVCRNVGKRDLSNGDMFRFVFLPGHELLNLFPPKTRYQARYGRQDPEEGTELTEAATLQSQPSSVA